MRPSAETIAGRERAFADALAADGLRMTHQRLEIIREIASADDHPDAETVFSRARERVPTLSQDTVYRTLSGLARRHLVVPISMPRATRFDPDRAAHHHFICDRCGRLVDVGVEEVASPLVPETLDGIGEVHSAHLELWGVCDRCRAPGRPENGNSRESL